MKYFKRKRAVCSSLTSRSWGRTFWFS